MKLIKPSFLIKEQEPELIGIYRQIEYAGRICYKSSNKITPDSAKDFVDKLVKSGHGAMLEHGTVYLTIPNKNISRSLFIYKCEINPYSKVVKTDNNIYITTNYRVIIENNWTEHLKYMTSPSEFHARRTTVKFICDRAVANEFVRHRAFSFAQESTRYCNYIKDKFNNQLTFIIPCWIKDIKEGDFYKFIEYYSGDIASSREWYATCLNAEKRYFRLIENDNWKPQQARSILPNSLKTELVMTGFDSDWQHFFELRCAANAHPQAKELADMLKDKMM